MQFRSAMIEAIKAGRKTQTRRPMKAADTVRGIGSIGPNGTREELLFDVADKSGRSRWRVGGRYSVCPGRGKNGVGLIQLTAIRPERVGEISEVDARAEGFESREAFLAAWKELYPKADLEANVWVLEFKAL